MDALAYRFANGKLKKILCIVLCILILFTSWAIQIQQSYAYAWALTPQAMKVLGALLLSAGIIYTSSDSIPKITNWWYSTAAPALKEELSKAVNGIKNGVVTLTDELWNSVRSFVREHFGIGANEVTNTLHVVNLDETVLPYSVNTTEIYPIGGAFTLQGHTYSLAIKEEYADYYFYGLKLDDAWIDGFTAIDSLKGTDITMYLYAENYVGLRIMVLKKGLYDTSFVSYAGPAIPNTFDLVKDALLNPSGAISVTGADIVGDATYDFKDEKGKREVGVPTTLDDLVGKTYDDVQNPESETPTEPEDKTGWLEKIWKSITGGITGLLEKIWGFLTGFWDKLRDIIGALLKPIIDAIGSVISGIAAIPAEIAKFFDLTRPINLEPLKVTGTLFTKSFPFSLPWDLLHSFTSLAADAANPDFSINVPGTPFWDAYTIPIDLSRFSDLLKFAKAAELVAFDIGLIFLTRKLLGGSV